MILLIDDDPVFLEEAERAFRAAGLEVLPGSSAHAALAAIRAVPELNLAIIDLDLPDTSGLELLGRIKELRPEMRIIAMTGVLPGYVLEVATYLGADTALLKPVTQEWIRTVQEIKAKMVNA